MKKLSLLYCAAAMLLSACANDPTEIPQIETRAVVFEASNHTDESRTEINGMKILWQSQDAVGLFSPQISAAKNSRIVVEEQYVGQSRAVLKSDLRYANETDDHTFYAYYPYAEGQTDYTRVEGTIAMQQDGTIGQSAFMWASKTVKPSDTPVGLQFQHPFTYIDILVGTGNLYAGATVKEVRLKAADGKVLSGKFKADLTTGEVTFTDPVNEVAASANHVLDNYYRHAGYMVVNAEDLTGTTVDVYVTVSHDGQDITLRTTKEGRQFKPQSKVRMQLNVGVMTDIGREDRERQALIAIYKALNGDNWTNNQNWCSDNPLSEWSGVGVYNGSVSTLSLSGVSGTLPAEVGQLTNLAGIFINGLSGFSTALYDCRKLQQISFVMPSNCSWSYEGIGKLSELRGLTVYSPGSQTPLSAEVGQCTKLQALQVRGSGTLPKELGNLTNLKQLRISNSNFSGELPAELGNCTGLVELELYNNRFTGRIPDGIVQNKDLWRYSWAYVVQGNSFDLSDTEIPAEKFNVTGIDGKTIDAAQIYASNEYTLLYQFAPGYPSDAENVTSLYGRYKDKGLGIIGYTSSLIDGSTEESVRTFVSDNGIEWPTFLWNMNDGTNLILPQKDGWRYVASYPYNILPAYTLVDKNGRVVCYDFNGNLKTISSFITLKLGESAYYKSTDYSQDGQVLTLQKAAVGRGIDLVFMGEGFTDKDMAAGGKYEQKMQEAVEQFFAYEPYKTFRNRFNAYAVKAVSPNAEFAEDAVNAFDENTQRAFDYAQKVPGINTDHQYVNIIYNTSGFAGRSYTTMFYGDGSYVAFNMEGVNVVLNHEACGHGFAKLADEYVEPGYESTTFTDTADLDERHAAGWYVNVDYRNDPSSVRWSRLLNDPRYAAEGLGIYEGAKTYGLGCYRSTENSMMRYNDCPFNAPSREQIYKRIMSESEGEGWQYDYEAFVAYDEVNRKANLRTPLAVHPHVMRPANHRPPVIVKGTWRDAK